MKLPGAVLLLTVFSLHADSLLISPNAVWKYLDIGSDEQSFWREIDYFDDWWESGEAELGYGDASEGVPERTVIGFGPNPNNKFVTTYFRHAFVVTNIDQITNLTL